MLALSFAAALLGVVILWRQPSRPVTGAFGDLSQEDQAQIQRLIRRELWRQAFPNFSWRTLGEAPRWLRFITTARIQEAGIRPLDQIELRVASHSADYFYLVRKLPGRGSHP